MFKRKACRASYTQTLAVGLMLAGWLTFLVPEAMAARPRTVVLAAAEMQPYLSESVARQGYAAEVVQAALKHEGYKVEIRFYPPARARSLAQSGKVDGLLPVSPDPALEADFLLSAPFPGANVGLLKKRSLSIPYPADAFRRPEDTLRGLSALRFGAVRGAVQAPAFDKADFLKREFVADDLQNLDKLALGRLDLMVIDKYRAGDLMVMYRPHLIGQLEFVNPPLFRSDFHVGFARQVADAASLKAAFDRGLAGLQRDGEIERLLAQHGLNPPRSAAEREKSLTVATVNNPDMLIMKRLSLQFEKQNPGVRLDWRVLDEHTLRRRLMTDLAIGDGQFDVMTIGSFEAPLWGARGWLKPFDNLPPAYEAADLLPPVRNGLSQNGKLYALPIYAESSMTYYRTDLFRKAGLSMPAQPTYSEIARLAAALNDPDHGIHGICLRGKPGWGENLTMISTMVNSFGGRWFDAQWQPELESQAWRQAVTMYVELLQRYGPPDAINNGFNENLQLFAAGRCAIWIDATVAASALSNPKTSRVAGQFGFARAPAEATATGASWLWIWALAIPETASNKAMARRFVEWATGPAYVRSVARSDGWVAVPPGTRFSTYASPEYRATAPFAEFVAESILGTNSRPAGRQYEGIQWVAIPEFPAIGHLVAEELSQALAGKQSVAQSLSSANAGVMRLMRDAGYLKTPRKPLP